MLTPTSIAAFNFNNPLILGLKFSTSDVMSVSMIDYKCCIIATYRIGTRVFSVQVIGIKTCIENYP